MLQPLRSRLLPLSLLLLWCGALRGQGTLAPGFTDASGELVLRGKVVMADGSPAPAKVTIFKLCPNLPPSLDAVTNKRGEFIWRAIATGPTIGRADARSSGNFRCWLVARKAGFESNRIDLQDPAIYRRLDLPPFVLRPAGEVPAPPAEHTLSSSAAKVWAQALKAMGARGWADAERLAQQVTKLDPKFAPAWSALGAACWNQNRMEDAHKAFVQAVAADPSSLYTRAQLLRTEIALRLWERASATAAALIQADTAHHYLDAYVNRGIARFMLHDLDGAAAALAEALRLDTKRQLPLAEYLMGVVSAAKGDRQAAAVHFRSYLQAAPAGSNAELAKQQLEQLDRPEPVIAAQPLPATILRQSVEPEVVPRGEATVPGGRRALAAVAGMHAVPAPDDFFLEYCRAITTQNSRLTENPMTGFLPALRAYTAAVPELAALAEPRDGRATITVSLAAGANAERSERILKLLGWRITRRSGTVRVEPGEEPADGPRHRMVRALGVDDLGMKQELEAGRSFEFELPSEDAALFGGAGWAPLLTRFTSLPGGIAQAFAEQPRLAKTYAGLGALGSDLALMLIGRVGLRRVDAEYAEVLWLYGGAFRLAAGQLATPGGGAAAPVWTKLAGASPGEPAKFLEAVLKVDGGRLAAFYAALSRADDAHAAFFLAGEARARRFYDWYRDSDELRAGIGMTPEGWRAQLFQKLPLDAAGRVRFPGGREAWTSGKAAADDEVLLPSGNPARAEAVDLEALLAVARLEEERGAPLDAESAALLARNFAQWHSLFPYFTAMRGLGPAGFRALDRFTTAVAAAPAAEQNAILGEWYSLTTLIVLGARSGALDDAAAAGALTEACLALGRPGHSSQALAILRSLVPDKRNPDEAVADLLGLSGERRIAFDRVRRLQDAPRLDSFGTAPSGSGAALALAGLVYGAILHPDSQLLHEDPNLLKKHRFAAPPGSAIFQAASLVRSTAAAGSHLAGGFAGLEEIGKVLAAERVTSATLESASVPADAGPPESGGPSAEPTFRASGRLVEVHAVVTNSRERYVDHLAAPQFAIHERGKAVPISAFENDTAPYSCAILLDTTASMEASLPAVKSAALRLVSGLRPADAMAVYSLTGGISELQPFTTNKDEAARAVWRAELGEMTALYDGLLRVTRDLSARSGKKVIIVFTDGEDNRSTLSAQTAIHRAKAAGIPIYTIGQGLALHNRSRLSELEGISQATGGLAFTIHSSTEVPVVFDRVMQDLLHGYLLGFQPLPSEDREWREIHVMLPALPGLKVRARSGYYPE